MMVESISYPASQRDSDSTTAVQLDLLTLVVTGLLPIDTVSLTDIIHVGALSGQEAGSILLVVSEPPALWSLLANLQAL